MVLISWDGHGLGPADILDASTLRAMHHCEINTDTYWPQWLGGAHTILPHGLASGLGTQIDVGSQQCVVNDSSGQSGRLTLAQGQPVWEPCGHRWSHMSPDGALITTLLAETDGDLIYGSGRSAHAFQHHYTASATEASVSLVRKGVIMSSPLSGQVVKSHLFMCAWLPGTAIYAAAALGYVYVVDGMHNNLLRV